MFWDYFQHFYLHQEFGVTYILTNIICAVAISLIFNKTKWRWRSVLRLFIDALLTWVVSFLLQSLFYTLSEATGAAEFNMVSRYCVWAAVALLHTIYPRDIEKYWMRFTYAILLASFIFLLISTSGSIGSAYTAEHGYPSNILNDLTAYLVLFLIIGVVVLFKVLDVSKFRYINPGAITLLDSFFLVSYAIAVVEDQLLNAVIFGPILFAGTMIEDFLAYYIFYLNAKNYNEVIIAQAYANKLENEKQQLEISDAKYEELHRIRHDIKDQFSLLSELVKEKKYDEMEHYFADISEKVHVQIDFVDCGNPLISAIANMELTKAHAQGLDIVYRIAVPKELPISSTDLTSFLSNLLDNAIEAQARDGKKEPIQVDIKREGNYLFVYLENTFDSAKHPFDEKRIASVKEDAANHGYGRKIIQQIIERNHGYINYVVKGDSFHVSSMLSLAEEVEAPDAK
jgi:hypothetical protein